MGGKHIDRPGASEIIVIDNQLWRDESGTLHVIIDGCVPHTSCSAHMVVFMVILSLTDIVGFLHFWNITIDVISCINIVLAVGLCVDYSVHIGHAYLVSKGKTSSVTLLYPPVSTEKYLQVTDWRKQSMLSSPSAPQFSTAV